MVMKAPVSVLPSSVVEPCSLFNLRMAAIMVRLLALGICVLSLLCYALSAPTTSAEAPRRPLVIWHGMGDSYASPGMLEFMNLIKEVHPGIFIHSVYLKEDLEEDRKAAFVSLSGLRSELSSPVSRI